MSEMGFRTGMRPSRGLDLSQFIHSQEAQDALAVGTSNKQAEINALLERARLHEEGATQREESTRASVESVADANRELQRDIHTKDWVTKEQIDNLNAAQGTNYPSMDMPMAAFTSLQATDRSVKAQEAIAARQLATQGMIADRQEAGMNFRAGLAADAESRRWAHEDRRAGETQRQQDLNQRRLDDAEAAKNRTVAQGSVLSQIQGALNTRENKQGLPTAFDPGQALIDNPGAVAELGQQIKQAGGLPKGAPVTPLKPFSSFEKPPMFWGAREYGERERDYNAKGEIWKQNIAPPTTAGGSSLTKGKIPAELDAPPAPVPTPTGTNLGGMGAASSPPVGYISKPYGGKTYWVNPTTKHVMEAQ